MYHRRANLDLSSGQTSRKASWIVLTANSEPPRDISLGLEEALDWLAALEDARDVLVDTDHLSVLAQVEGQIQVLSRRLGFDKGGTDAT